MNQQGKPTNHAGWLLSTHRNSCQGIKWVKLLIVTNSGDATRATDKTQIILVRMLLLN